MVEPFTLIPADCFLRAWPQLLVQRYRVVPRIFGLMGFTIVHPPKNFCFSRKSQSAFIQVNLVT
mgnify:CR=1 FL=1